MRRAYLWKFAELLHCGPADFDRLSIEDMQAGIRIIDARLNHQPNGGTS